MTHHAMIEAGYSNHIFSFWVNEFLNGLNRKTLGRFDSLHVLQNAQPYTGRVMRMLLIRKADRVLWRFLESPLLNYEKKLLNANNNNFTKWDKNSRKETHVSHNTRASVKEIQRERQPVLMEVPPIRPHRITLCRLGLPAIGDTKWQFQISIHLL